MHERADARPAVLSELPADLADVVARALAEDLGAGDLTAQLVPAGVRGHARVVSREPAVLCGGPWVDEVFRALDPSLRVKWHADEGEAVRPNQLLFEVLGPARPILSGERAALNFLQILSGTATVTRAYVDEVAGTGCTILDTRKTLPGLRLAQKYAVRCGGGRSHRLGLYDGILVKENHIAAAGSIAAAVAAVRRLGTAIPVEVEVESLAELEQAFAADADLALLDDFPLADLVKAVAMNRARVRPLGLEASGGIDLSSVRAFAATGVDYISIGALTKHVRAIDLSLRLALGG